MPREPRSRDRGAGRPASEESPAKPPPSLSKYVIRLLPMLPIRPHVERIVHSPHNVFCQLIV